jgi:2-polyprenyl-3-methyl-5-hydroxy-6-metoxy-1,4-benzoquinol methylase
LPGGSPNDIARFFDRESCCSARRPARQRLSRVSRTLLQLLDDAGLAGRTILDVGCGQGGLSISLSRHGAAAVSGVDLSPESIAAARRAGSQAGGSLRFAVGDAATGALEPHDVVVLNKVVCCYFDPAALLANAVAAARSFLALSVPHSKGIRGALARLLIGTENSWRRLRRDPFRAFVHDVGGILSLPVADGFRPVAQRGHGLWDIVVLERLP